MSTRDLTFTAGETKELGSGEHFILLECDSAVTVEFYKNASPLNLYSGVLGGFKYSAPEEPLYEGGLIVGMRSMRFDSVRITSATAQTIKADVSTGDVDYSRLQGSVTVSNPLGSTEQIQTIDRYKGALQSIMIGTTHSQGFVNPAGSGITARVRNISLNLYNSTGNFADNDRIHFAIMPESDFSTLTAESYHRQRLIDLNGNDKQPKLVAYKGGALNVITYGAPILHLVSLCRSGANNLAYMENIIYPGDDIILPEGTGIMMESSVATSATLYAKLIIGWEEF
jgi:hypothetical protein